MQTKVSRVEIGHKFVWENKCYTKTGMSPDGSKHEPTLYTVARADGDIMPTYIHPDEYVEANIRSIW